MGSEGEVISELVVMYYSCVQLMVNMQHACDLPGSQRLLLVTQKTTSNSTLLLADHESWM